MEILILCGLSAVPRYQKTTYDNQSFLTAQYRAQYTFDLL